MEKTFKQKANSHLKPITLKDVIIWSAWLGGFMSLGWLLKG